MERIYACIDLKSFYASCECVERGLNPITTNLVVADSSRTEKTICLAVSPSLKEYGLSGRARLYEVIKKVEEINIERKKKIYPNNFIKKSVKNDEIRLNPFLQLDYLVAKPRMRLYMEYSAKIYNIYLKYLEEKDIFVYSIDEVFCDITDYLKIKKTSPREFISTIIQDIYRVTGITATGGIGTNLYLAKVAMDILAKHAKPDNYGVRICELDEISYRKKLWLHQPLKDFWRIGSGYANRLEKMNLYTMGDIAQYSITHENDLFNIFGINAEILIDHAWGRESCTIQDIKAFHPQNNSISTNQVLHTPYHFKEGRIVTLEMIDNLALSLVDKNLVTNKVSLTIVYDISNMEKTTNIFSSVKKTTSDWYGRIIPKEDHGSETLNTFTSSSEKLMQVINKLYNRITNPSLLIRRINISLENVIDQNEQKKKPIREQMTLFSDSSCEDKLQELNEQSEKKAQRAILDIKKKYGKNAILRGINLVEGATGKERNEEIGGHHE